MEKTLAFPLKLGLFTPEAVLIEAPGPAAFGPAQATQFSHPAILWICDFTVWADERSDTTLRMNRAITKMDRALVLFFTITTFTPGDDLSFCFGRDIRDEVGDYRRIYSATTVFDRRARKLKIVDY
jgi:hypothetical protein